MKQELRRADFPGDFLNVSEKLAINRYFDTIRIFTPAIRRRYGDVEYVSELLAAMIGGIQDKKTTLDNFYIQFAGWDKSNKQEILNRFTSVLREFGFIFDDSLDISKTRFRQKADFYSLFLVIDEFVSKGLTVKNKDIKPLQDDLMMLQENIRPESNVEICSEYAIKCVSQANSASSRRWRRGFLKSILAGTYVDNPLTDIEISHQLSEVFYRLIEDLDDSMGFCPDPKIKCETCGTKISSDFSDWVLAWHRSDTVHQIANAFWIHRPCLKDQDVQLFLDVS